jgi:orotidine-5'-phosphate decarboxylase
MTKLYLALDKMSKAKAIQLACDIARTKVGVKMNDLLVTAGSDFVRTIRSCDVDDVFVDVKAHDTDDTVAATAKAWLDKGGTVMTVHASGGREMIAAAVATGIKVFAVTVLTSFTEERCQRIYNRSIAEQVKVLALEAAAGGAHGIICSAKEVDWLSEMPELSGMEKVVPGTRSAGAKMHDQKRSATAAEAVASGATGLVLGREVTEAEHPSTKLSEIIGTLLPRPAKS